MYEAMSLSRKNRCTSHSRQIEEEEGHAFPAPLLRLTDRTLRVHCLDFYLHDIFESYVGSEAKGTWRFLLPVSSCEY